MGPGNPKDRGHGTRIGGFKKGVVWDWSVSIGESWDKQGGGPGGDLQGTIFAAPRDDWEQRRSKLTVGKNAGEKARCLQPVIHKAWHSNFLRAVVTISSRDPADGGERQDS